MNTKHSTKYTLAGLGLTMGLAVAAAAAPALAAPTAPTERLAKTGATLDGITVALGSLATGILIAPAGYTFSRRYRGGSGR